MWPDRIQNSLSVLDFDWYMFLNISTIKKKQKLDSATTSEEKKLIFSIVPYCMNNDFVKMFKTFKNFYCCQGTQLIK